MIKGGPDGAQYTPFPAQHQDLEFSELLNVTRDEILALYNVPHEMVGASMVTTQTSARSPGIREKRMIFWQDTIQPKHRKKADVWNNHYELDPEVIWHRLCARLHRYSRFEARLSFVRPSRKACDCGWHDRQGNPREGVGAFRGTRRNTVSAVKSSARQPSARKRQRGRGSVI